MRLALGTKYCIGNGVEIGAGHNPWPVHASSRVVYVDRARRADLLAEFPAASRHRIPETTLVADGFELTRAMLFDHMPASGLDFVVNSHVLEHTPRPADAIERWRDLLRPGGHLVMAIPNKDRTFDKPRRLTPWLELVEGDLEAFKRKQLREWGSVVERLSGDRLEQMVETMMRSGAHIHFAVWDLEGLRDFVLRIERQGRWACVEFQGIDHEVFVVLRRL